MMKLINLVHYNQCNYSLMLLKKMKNYFIEYKLFYKINMTERKFKTFYHLYKDYSEQLSQKYDKFTLFIKIGLFYEMYSFSGNMWSSQYLNTIESKKLRKVAAILNLTVTKRKKKRNNKADAENPLMLGFPIQSLNKYKSKLLENNYSVIIIEDSDREVGVKKLIFLKLLQLIEL